MTNEPVILECELSRTPRDKIQWFKDGKALPSRLSSRIKVEELENGKVHRIIFSPLTEEDLGVYSVKVENLTSEARLDMKSELLITVNRAHTESRFYYSLFYFSTEVIFNY